MTILYASREIVRNPLLLEINGNDSFIEEDKKAHKILGVYIWLKLANEFFEYEKKQELLVSAHKIKQNVSKELKLLEGNSDDGL